MMPGYSQAASRVRYCIASFLCAIKVQGGVRLPSDDTMPAAIFFCTPVNSFQISSLKN